MVLSLMRKHAKSWLIKFLIAMIAIVFVFYFGYSFTSDRALKIAYVNGEVITGPEYEKAYDEFWVAIVDIPSDRFSGELLYPWGDEKGSITKLIEYFIEHAIEHRDEILTAKKEI